MCFARNLNTKVSDEPRVPRPPTLLQPSHGPPTSVSELILRRVDDSTSRRAAVFRRLRRALDLVDRGADSFESLLDIPQRKVLHALLGSAPRPKGSARARHAPHASADNRGVDWRRRRRPSLHRRSGESGGRRSHELDDDEA